VECKKNLKWEDKTCTAVLTLFFSSGIFRSIKLARHTSSFKKEVMCLNADKLKGKLVEKKKSYSQCAEALSITLTTFSNKMNGSSKFYIDEVRALSNFLKLTNNEKIDIFLN